MEKMGKIRVLLVDDHTILKEGLKALLNLSEDIQVIAEAADGREAIDCVHRYDPDVVVMDIAMPGMGGIEATRRITNANPHSRVLILSQHDNERYVLPVLQAGALGYVVKRAVGEELMTAIRTVYRGEPYLRPCVEKMVLRDYQEQAKATQDSENGEYGLTERQKEVLKLVAEGYTSQEIAELLHLSIKTVNSHRENIYQKLGTSNLAELIKIALRLGMIDL